MGKRKEIQLISKKNELAILIIFLSVYFMLNYMNEGLFRLSKNKSFIGEIELFNSTIFLVKGVVSIIIYFIIAPKILKSINWKSILLAIVYSFATFIAVRYIIEQIITDLLFNKVNYFEGTTISFYIYDNLHYGTFIVFSSLFLWMTIHLINTLQQKNKFEKEKKEAEINFLKSQINPHFLFNTLNNIYSLVSVNSPHSLKAIENLSAIMRFTTYETNKDKIEIEREIDYINQYLDLEQIRYGEKFYVEKEFLIENSKKLIHPYIISPLIENAIKHGVVKDINHPIKINLRTNTEHLEISVSNKINQHQKDETSGIGLTNLKKRLNYYFGNNYTFEIKNDYETFHIYLKIPLNDEN
ncbi:sensor histidine kinase [Empedobacter falsenii]|uniref:sensor histidine kinase n=1 Tax=Empedobacter falsenii TaxID=343874 RepID=UPI001C560398|nr:histidine kinase [Empedobacter falsenii]MBW1617116.1 GHKL domain-containing protein [Empedobacter falsenii]